MDVKFFDIKVDKFLLIVDLMFCNFGLSLDFFDEVFLRFSRLCGFRDIMLSLVCIIEKLFYRGVIILKVSVNFNLILCV